MFAGKLTKCDVICSGPEHWSEQFPICLDTHQSPINIEDASTVYKPDLYEFTFENYNALDLKMTLTNNGHAGKSFTRQEVSDKQNAKAYLYASSALFVHVIHVQYLVDLEVSKVHVIILSVHNVLPMTHQATHLMPRRPSCHDIAPSVDRTASIMTRHRPVR